MDNIKFIIIPYEKCKKDLITFRNAHRENNQNETYFDWRYLNRPNKSAPIILWAEEKSGKKLGSISLIPHHFMINCSTNLFGILGDISVASEWRGKGIATQMFDYLSDCEEVKNLKAQIVLPNENAASALRKSGWNVVSRIERYVKIIHFEERLKRLLRIRWLCKLASLPLNCATQLLSVESYIKFPAGYKWEIVHGFDERFDDLWKNSNNEGTIRGFRNKAYLNWRYAEHPQLKYEVFTLTRNNQLCGYIVFHAQKDRYYIDDLLCVNKNRDSKYLLCGFLKLVRKHKVVSSISIGLNQNAFAYYPLRLFGFVKRRDHQKVMLQQNGAIGNAYQWYLTTGDKDT